MRTKEVLFLLEAVIIDTLSADKVLSCCIGWRKNNRANHPTSYLDTRMKTGSESIEAALRRRRILFAGFVACMEDTRLPKCVMFGELMGGAGCVGGGAGKRVDRMLLGRPQSFRYQRRPVDDCSPGREKMMQGGGTRGGMFHGEIDRCRKIQSWTTVCSVCPNVTGRAKDSC